jgi:predicted dehydrogenase
MKAKVNIAVIGCGYWGKNLIRNFHKINCLYSVTDNSSIQANKFANKYNVKKLSFDEVIKDKNIKGVVVATPTNSHYKILSKLLLTDKYIFIEKPMVSNISEALEIKKKFKKKLKNIFVGHLLHYHPILIKIKKILKNKKILNISSERKNFGKFRNYEDVIWSFAPHDISIILSLIKTKPSTIKSNKIFIINKKISDKATIDLNFNNKINAHINISWLEPKKKHELIIQTKKFFLVFNDTLRWEEKLSRYDYIISKNLKNTNISNKFIKVKYHEPLLLECKNFKEMIVKRKVPYNNFQESLEVLKVLSFTK